MKCYNKDYASYIISDEEERRIRQYQRDEFAWQVKKGDQFILKHGMKLITLLTFTSLLSLAFLVVDFWPRASSYDPLALIIWGIQPILWGSQAVYYFFRFRKVKAEGVLSR